MPTSSEYKERRKARKAKRDATAARLKKWVPLIEVLCKKYGIAMTEIPGGHQFRVHEYIVSWWLTTNKIVIQLQGTTAGCGVVMAITTLTFGLRQMTL